MATLPGKVVTLFDAATIAGRVAGLAQEITERIPEPFVVVGLLKGAFVFVADLVRALDAAGCRPRVEFLQVSSYGLGKESSGIARIRRLLPGFAAELAELAYTVPGYLRLARAARTFRPP